ncbi:hypothetical protein Gpo141_00006075 [Globisporangium polare]
MTGISSGNMFPALHPTPEQQSAFVQVAQRRLDATVAHYLQHAQTLGSRPRRELSRKHWKSIKSHDDLTVYKERNPQRIAASDVGENWTDPKLLVTAGSIVGELDDLMYGVVTPDTASMLLKASVTKSRLIGGAVLHQLQGPTTNEPFRFLGVKWFVMAPPTTLNSVVRPRDAVFVEATGIKVLPNGQRFGYQVMQSIDIPGYASLENSHHAIVRARLSICSVFKQLANGTVDVYVRGYVAASSDIASLKLAANVSLSSWNAIGCAQFKKLMWCAQHPRFGRTSPGNNNRNSSSSNGVKMATRIQQPRSCADCSKRFGAFSSNPGLCVLCEQWLCSKCRVVTKLRDVDAELRLEEREAVVCHKCVTHANRQSTVVVAAQEVHLGRFTTTSPQQQPCIAKLWSFRNSRSASRIGGRESARETATTFVSDQDEYLDGHHSHYEDDCQTSSSDAMSTTRTSRRAMSDGGVLLFDPTQLYEESSSSSESQSHASTRDHSSDSEQSVSSEKRMMASAYSGFIERNGGFAEDGDEEPALGYPLAPEQDGYAMVAYSQQQQLQYQQENGPERATRATQQQQEQLWRQMLDLRVAAEQVYQMTMQTTDAQLRRLEKEGVAVGLD